MTDGEVTLERRGPVAVVTLRRAHKRNALNEAMWSGLAHAAESLAARLPRVVIVTGEGESFCAGMDVSLDNPQIVGLAEATVSHDVGPMRALLERLRPSFDALVALPVPVIAAVNGLAFGGGAELAIRCDLRVMERSATLCLSEVRLGLIPDMGSSVKLTRLVGPAVAAELVLTARTIDGAQAAALGLVNRLSEPGQSLADAIALADEIAANGPRAVRAALAVLRRVPDLDEQQGMALERDVAARLMASGECIHGLTARAMGSAPQFPDPED